MWFVVMVTKCTYTPPTLVYFCPDWTERGDCSKGFGDLGTLLSNGNGARLFTLTLPTLESCRRKDRMQVLLVCSRVGVAHLGQGGRCDL